MPILRHVALRREMSSGCPIVVATYLTVTLSAIYDRTAVGSSEPVEFTKKGGNSMQKILIVAVFCSAVISSRAMAAETLQVSLNVSGAV